MADTKALAAALGSAKSTTKNSGAPVEMKFKDVTFTRDGDKINIPEGMSYAEASAWCSRKQAEDELTVAVYEEILAYPLDGAYAFARAIAQRYGFSGLVRTPGFFGPTPPAMISFEVGVNETAQVPWGSVQIPGIDGTLETGIAKKDGQAIFVIHGEVKQKNRAEISALANLTRDFVRERSVYRGKAIRVTFPEKNEKLDPTRCPKFLNVKDVAEEELIFPEETRKLVDVALFTPIEQTEACRKYKIPLKRGVLLEGPYGVGKTLTAYVTAKKAEANGWTFIYLEKVSQLDQAIQFAQQYQPAVIFAEDIDRTVSGGRSAEMDAVLNTIDGINNKANEIVVVLTTNYVENINRAMLRPGRLDAVVSVRPPDEQAVERLIRLYGRGLVSPTADLTIVGIKLAGHIPAVIREVVERAKLAGVRRIGGMADTLTLDGDDLSVAATGMLDHLALMKEPQKDTRSDMQVIADALGEHLHEAVVELAEGRYDKTGKFQQGGEALSAARVATAPKAV